MDWQLLNRQRKCQALGCVEHGRGSKRWKKEGGNVKKKKKH